MSSLFSIFRLALRNLWSRKSRTLLTALGIVLGVAVVLAIAITNESTLASIRHIFDEASGQAHLVVASNSVMGDPFDGSALLRVSKMPGVSLVAPSVSHKTLLAAEADQWGLSFSVSGASTANDLLVFGVDTGVDRQVRDYDLVAGNFLPDDHTAYAALLVQDYADDKGLAVGDDLTILISSGVESLRIVGLIRKAGPGMQNNGAVAVVPIGAAQAIFDMGGDLSQLDVLAEPSIAESPRRLEELKLQLAATLGPGYQVLYPAARGSVVSKMLASYQLGLSFFSAMALFVASFVFEDAATDPAAALAELAAGDGLLISTTLADRYGLAAGDSLRLETRRGEHDFRVIGVVVDFTSQGYVVNGTRADLARYFGKNTADEFIVILKPGLDAKAEAKRLEDRYGQSRHIVVETATDFRKKVTDLAGQAFALFDVLGLIGIIIAALGVVNTLMMNVFERQREIGGLRSLGMIRAQVARMVLAESAAMGAIGGLFGMVFGFFLSKVFLLGLQVVAGYTVNYNLPPRALAISLAIALIVSQGAALYPAWHAANVRIIEAIQHE